MLGTRTCVKDELMTVPLNKAAVVCARVALRLDAVTSPFN